MPKKILAADQDRTPDPDILGKAIGTAIFNSTAQPTLQIPRCIPVPDRGRVDNR